MFGTTNGTIKRELRRRILCVLQLQSKKQNSGNSAEVSVQEAKTMSSSEDKTAFAPAENGIAAKSKIGCAALLVERAAITE
jgi:hypothetical protein